MNTEMPNHRRRFLVIALLGLFIGLLAFAIADEALNQEIAFEVVINNTNLAPNVAGHPFGTGERTTGGIYYANNSAIQLFVFAHADTAGQNAQINLSINDTVVSEIALRPAGAAENTHTQLTAIIPRYAKYQVNFTNYHHYEWREYPILSGRNGTLSINITQGAAEAGTTNHFNLTNKSLSDHNVTSDLDMMGYNVTNATNINNLKIVYSNRTDGNYTWVNITGLDIRRDLSYLLELNIFTYAVGGTNVQLFINNDINISNYTRQYVYADGSTSLIINRDHDPGVIGTQQNWGASAVESIYLDAQGRGHYVSQASLNGVSGVIFFNGQYTHDNFQTNITTLNIKATVANGIGKGSEIILTKP